MNGTALYRALVSAGAPEDQAKDASDVVDDKFAAIDERLTRLEIMVAELRVTNRLILAVVLIMLAFIFKLSFE